MRKPIFIALACSFFIFGCKSEPTLQKYFVENTDDQNFIALDIAPSIMNVEKQQLTAEQKQSLEAFEKVNILAFKLDEKNKAKFEEKRDEVAAILKDEKYQELMKVGKGKEVASVSFVGDENNIDEFILFANKKDMGFAVVRVLGNDMNPTDILNLMSVLQKSNVDMNQLKPLQEMFIKP